MKKHIIHLIGSFVELTTVTSVSVVNETEEGRFSKKVPFAVSGYFIDIDDEWVYIGNEQGEVTDIVRIKRIVHLGKTVEVDKFEEMLNEAEEPTDKEHYN